MIQDGPSLESILYLNVTLRYLGPCVLGTLGPWDFSGSKSRSPKGDQSLLRRLLGQNWSPLGLLLLRKSPIEQNIEENVVFFKQFGTHIRI